MKKISDGTSNKANGSLGDVLLQKKLYYRPSIKGQTGSDLSDLAVDPLTKKYKPRLLLACDGEEVSVLDVKKGTPTHFSWKDLPKNADIFWPLAGHEIYEGFEETKADRDAAYALSKLYDAIITENPDWNDEARHHDLNLLMTRLLFCMFAEDTGIFEDHLFTRFIADYTGETGGDVHRYLVKLFDHLNTPDRARQATPKWLKGFHYVNGGLFRDKTDIPRFSKRARRYLINAAELDWAGINPDIFGTMIQAVVAPKMRGDLGMHYTSVENIMKVIHPLFLLSLERSFDLAKDSSKKLESLLVRLSKIRIFDPACGSGNFLIVAYQKLRELEMQIFQRLEELSGNRTMGFSRISLDNFYGIEVADFAAETAKLSLWIAEYQMNQKFKSTFGDAPPDLPLRDGGHIVTSNALRVDWLTVCPPTSDEAVETYICGNPPYKGTRDQTKSNKEDMQHVFKGYSKKYKNLDYVGAWFLKAAIYNKTVPSKASLVSTNSICQGEQVSLIWPIIFSLGAEILFAFKSFKWTNLAKKNAGVTCVIVCIGHPQEPRYIYDNTSIIETKNINPYLIPGENIWISKSVSPISQLPKMEFGSMANDDGNLILSKDQKTELIDRYPECDPFIKQIYGGQEFLRNVERYCLWISDESMAVVNHIDDIRERVSKTRAHRASSPRPATNKLASIAHKFGEIRHQETEKIVIPQLSSVRRQWFACGYLKPNDVVIAPSLVVNNANPAVMAIISSRMHMLWVATVCGKFKTDYRYSNLLGYNTFPIPELSKRQLESLAEHAWRIIEARESHLGKTIAWLYNPDTMPANLLSAHRELDDTLEKIYIGRPFENNTERLEHLFKLYTKLTKKHIKASL